MRIIEITVTPDGKISIETKGFTGEFCRQASEFLERALGQRTSERLTSEFYQTTTQQLTTEQRS